MLLRVLITLLAGKPNLKVASLPSRHSRLNMEFGLMFNVLI